MAMTLYMYRVDLLNRQMVLYRERGKNMFPSMKPSCLVNSERSGFPLHLNIHDKTPFKSESESERGIWFNKGHIET